MSNGLDIELFQRLLWILKELHVPKRGEKRAYNLSGVARTLGVHRHTLTKWETDPPTQWYWEIVLMEAIARQMPNAKASAKAIANQELRNLPARVNKLIADRATAIRLLADELGDGDEVPSDRILAIAKLKNISTYQVREAARLMCVEYKRVGKGKDHSVLWSWPSLFDFQHAARIEDAAEGAEPTRKVHKLPRKERSDKGKKKKG